MRTFSSAPTPNYLTDQTSGTATVTTSGGSHASGSHTTGNTGTENVGYGSFNIGEFDPNDFTFVFEGSSDPLLIDVGTVVTLKAGTYTMHGSSAPVVPDFTNTTITWVDSSLESLAPAQAITSVVPEPSSILLMGFGLSAFAMSRRRK